MTEPSSTPDLSSSIDQAAARTTFAGLSPLVCIVLLGFLAVAVPLPALSLYVHNDLGFSSFTVGLVIGVQSLVTVLSRHQAGLLCDRRGPRVAVLSGLPIAATAGIFYIVSAIAPLPQTGRLAILLIGRILLGFGESLFITGTMNWGIGRVGAARTGRVMSWQGIAMYAALGLGAPLGLAIHTAFGFAGVGLMTIVTPLLAVVFAILLPTVAATGGDRTPFHQVLGLIWLPGTILMLASVPFAGMAAFLPLDYAAQGWRNAGLAMTAFGICYIAVRLVGSHWPDTYGAGRVVGWSLAVEGLGQAMLWFAPHETVALSGAALTGIGFSLIFPAMGVIATSRVPVAQRGRAVGNFIAFFDIAIGLTGPIVGLVTVAFGYPSAFLAGVVATALAGAMIPAIKRIKSAP